MKKIIFIISILYICCSCQSKNKLQNNVVNINKKYYELYYDKNNSAFYIDTNQYIKIIDTLLFDDYHMEERIYHIEDAYIDKDSLNIKINAMMYQSAEGNFLFYDEDGNITKSKINRNDIEPYILKRADSVKWLLSAKNAIYENFYFIDSIDIAQSGFGYYNFTEDDCDENELAEKQKEIQYKDIVIESKKNDKNRYHIFIVDKKNNYKELIKPVLKYNVDGKHKTEIIDYHVTLKIIKGKTKDVICIFGEPIDGGCPSYSGIYDTNGNLLAFIYGIQLSVDEFSIVMSKGNVDYTYEQCGIFDSEEQINDANTPTLIVDLW